MSKIRKDFAPGDTQCWLRLSLLKGGREGGDSNFGATALPVGMLFGERIVEA